MLAILYKYHLSTERLLPSVLLRVNNANGNKMSDIILIPYICVSYMYGNLPIDGVNVQQLLLLSLPSHPQHREDSRLHASNS